MINDVNVGLRNSSVLMYADDTTLYVTGHNVNNLRISLQRDIEYISWWFGENKMKINMKKCKTMLFRKPTQDKIHVDFVLQGETISQVEDFRLLGIQLDECLGWSNHLSYLRNKLKSQLFLLNSVKKFLPEFCMRQLYYGLFHSHLSYGVAVWGRGCLRRDLAYINSLQKKALGLFTSKDVLTVDELVDVEFVKLGYRYLNETLCDDLNVFFTVTQNNGHNLRGAHHMTVPRFTREPTRNSFIYRVPFVWNGLPDTVNTLPFRSLLRKYKRILLDKRN
jgi:hypothetical protein